MKKGTNFAQLRNSSTIIQFNSNDYEEFFEELKPGIYETGAIDSALGRLFLFTKKEPKYKLINFCHGPVADIVEKAEAFFDDKTKQVFKELKMCYKIGMIIYGPHGTGKTSTATLVKNILIKKYNALCFDFTGKNLNFIKAVISFVRERQNNPIVCFVDEFDFSIRQEEESYLPFLDGIGSFDNMIFIGCTNKFDLIPDRIKKRKSRIKYCFEINSFPEEVYEQFAIEKIPDLTINDVKKIAFLAKENSLSIDELAHALIDHKIEGTPLEQAIKDSKE